MKITRRFFLKGMACTSLVPLSLVADRLKMEHVLDKMFTGVGFAERPSNAVAYITSLQDGKISIDWITPEQLYRDRE